MKEEQPKLVLNKRTVAHLNNLEMRHVRGGDGDDGNTSRNKCGDLDESIPEPVNVAKLLMSLVVKVC